MQVYYVNIYQKNGQHYAAIEMEYMPQGSASDLIENQFVSCRDALKIVIDSLFALEHAHNNGVLHRDFKPANIMLSNEGAKLSDFGIAASVYQTKTGSANGSPIYCAPEFFSGNYTDIVTEIYSVGISLFELCSNINDWDALIPNISIVQEGRAINHVGYSAHVPRKIRRICNKACSIDRDRRYQSAREMRQDLERLHIAIDWRMLSECSWEGNAMRKIHSMDIEDSRFITNNYRVNGRRRKDLCASFAAKEVAMNAQQRIVYETTFS